MRASRRARAIPRALALAFACAWGGSACAGVPPPPPQSPPPRKEVRTDDVPLPGPSVPFDACGDSPEGFEDWLASFSQHAIAEGIPAELAGRALGTLEYDREVIELDRAQRHAKKSFEEYVASHVTASRVRRGRAMLTRHAALLGKISERFGVPREILVAIWGLETDFGENQGNTRSLRALATLAWDCRRAPRFRGELSSALRLLQRGDLPLERMVGAWAGEIGQTQFLPSSWERFGIDFDGDGHIDLIGSSADALGSTAHYLAEHGWRAREPYGPSTPNFAVLAEWNRSETYRKTIVIFASKLQGAK
ncbi:MAG: lytic murein transglycosylase [Deltaproteobacteria bacterium]|nr:lytic murein transglycosylase [Deltaproteobacteria bacterium]